MHKFFRIQIAAFLVCVTFFATYAFASSETNHTPIGGEGVNTISGWNISNVHYRLAEDPSTVGAVEFDLDSPATQVAIGFGTVSERAFDCYNVDGHHWLCELNGIEVFRLIATGDRGRLTFLLLLLA